MSRLGALPLLGLLATSEVAADEAVRPFGNDVAHELRVMQTELQRINEVDGFKSEDGRVFVGTNGSGKQMTIGGYNVFGDKSGLSCVAAVYEPDAETGLRTTFTYRPLEDEVLDVSWTRPGNTNPDLILKCEYKPDNEPVCTEFSTYEVWGRDFKTRPVKTHDGSLANELLNIADGVCDVWRLAREKAEPSLLQSL